jgi:hypothetical protein
MGGLTHGSRLTIASWRGTGDDSRCLRILVQYKEQERELLTNGRYAELTKDSKGEASGIFPITQVSRV